MVQQQTAPKRQRQGNRVVGNFGGAVVRDIADNDLPLRRGFAVDLVIAYAHAQNAAQLSEAFKFLPDHAQAAQHQPVGGGAILIGQIGNRRRIAEHNTHIGAVDAALDAVIRIIALRIQNGECHALPPRRGVV